MSIPHQVQKQLQTNVFNQLIQTLQKAETGESIRLGKLGALRKTLVKGKVKLTNGKIQAYQTYRYSFRAFSALKEQ